MISAKVERARIAIAIAVGSVMCAACVSVPDSIKTTFAPHQGSDVDNFSASSPHSAAPPETLTQATVIAPAMLDASTVPVVHEGMEGLCVRNPNETTSDAGSALSSVPTTGMRNCLQDAGNQ